MISRGKLLVVEGGDGCGKQTQSRLLVERLTKEGFPAQYEDEPWAEGLGPQIRTELAKQKATISPLALQFLFTADRTIHVDKRIAPALYGGINVVADRYWPSTIAYGEALGIDANGVEALYLANSTAFPKPDAIFVLDLPPEVAVQRMQARGRPIDRHESDLKLQGKVGSAYKRLARHTQWNWHIINAQNSKEEIAAEIQREVLKLLR